jgi:hypothetical protein
MSKTKVKVKELTSLGVKMRERVQKLQKSEAMKKERD